MGPGSVAVQCPALLFTKSKTYAPGRPGMGATEVGERGASHPAMAGMVCADSAAVGEGKSLADIQPAGLKEGALHPASAAALAPSTVSPL